MQRVLGLWAASLVLCAATWPTGFPGPTYPQCETDAHCAPGREVCVYGECHGCALDSQCPADLMCLDYRCQAKPTCQVDSDCQDGKLCRDRQCTWACTQDKDCPSGQQCQNHQCKLPEPVCQVKGDCAANEVCRKGACVVPRPGDPDYVEEPVEPSVEQPPPEGLSGADLTGDRQLCGKESRVFFDFNLSQLRADGKDELARLARCLKDNAGMQALVQGHTDERGSTEYNMALGERRALAVRLYLKDLGVPPERIHLVSLGEERPLDIGHDEAAWARNRRAEIYPRTP